MYVEANGCVFECRIDGSGPSVTLTHGLATDMSTWDELANALRERFRVLRYDARGYGKWQAPAITRSLCERNPAAIPRMETMIRATSADGYCGCAAAFTELNYGSRLREIGCPVLAMCGTEHHGAPPENTRQMHQVFRTPSRDPASRHIASIEHPALFNRAVFDFLDSAEARVPAA